MNDLDVVELLSDASLQDPRHFAETLVRALFDAFSLTAVTLFVEAPASASVRLRAQHGFNYEDYRDFQLARRTLVGDAITSNELQIEFDLRASPRFLDKQLLAATDTACGAAIPLSLPGSGLPTVPTPFGAICIYSDSQESLNSALRGIAPLTGLLARLYVASLERSLVELRRTTVEQVAFKSSLTDLATTFIRLTANELGFEGGSVYVLAPLRDAFYLRGTTALKEGTDTFAQSFRPGSGNPIATALRRHATMIHSRTTRLLDPKKTPEQLPSRLRNGIVVPLDRADVKARGGYRSAIGAVVLLNKFTDFGKRRRLVDVSWEDQRLSEFAAEMFSVLAFQVQRSRDFEFNYERLVHAAAQGLQGALLNLQYIENDEAVRRRTGEPRLVSLDADRLSDAIAFVGDVEAQIRRGELAESELDRESVALQGEVLVPTQVLARRLVRARELGNWDVQLVAPPGGWADLPRLRMSNREALQCVFRNLVDNALKYSDLESDAHLLRISARRERGEIRVLVQDDGIGVAERYRERIFEDGYRSPVARDHIPAGIGKGLADCKQIVEQLGGSIRCIDPLDGLTTFEVTLPIV